MRNNTKRINITIVNAHWSNRGDEAALLALLEGVRKIYPDGRITILIKDERSVSGFPEMDEVYCFPAKFNAKQWDVWLSVVTKGYISKNKILKKTIRILSKTDLIIYSPGGSVINDRFFLRKQMEYMVPYMCAKFYRIPMFVAAPSVGPFETDKSRLLRKWLLKTPKVTCVREPLSKKYLEDIGVRENVYVTMDLAFMRDINYTANDEKLNDYSELKQFLDANKKVVGITITDFRWHVKLHNDTELLIKIEDSFSRFIKNISSRGFGILLIPQLFGNQNDYSLLERFSNHNTFIMDATMDADFQQYIISKLYAVVGMRYHSNIFAAKMGVPFIAVVYEEKMSGFLQMAGLEKYSITFSELSFQALNQKYSVLEEDYQKIQQTLKTKTSEWRGNALRTIKLLESINI